MFPFHFARKVAGVVRSTSSTMFERCKAGHNLSLYKVLHIVIAGILMISLLIPASASAGPQLQASVDPKILKQFATQTEVTFWVVLRRQANLDSAYSMENWKARGQFVYNRLQNVARNSQAGIRSMLNRRGKTYRSFWIVNAVQVTADRATLQALAARSDIERIFADDVYQIPPTQPGKPQSRINSVEWNIDKIRAPEVWSTFGSRGEGITVANIDSGVQFDHSALVSQYRGNLGGGNFDHNYNWFDSLQACNPAGAPCDDNGHGTHTMGTMVGDDGAPGVNQIGVAPGARWIAVKACDFFGGCPTEALMAAGQWILAPTDLNGENPRPDLRPHVVNNSWGGGSGDAFYQEIVNAWIASGIFPQFANGNSGPGCNTSGSPGDYTESYSAGAFDISNNIAGFSSRGSSPFGDIKPNIAAPGVDVRSSIPGNGYELFSGTSMASPHVAGAVALMWSAAPALVGDIATTRSLLDQTAIDVDDQSCGGSAADNNVWGEGRLDAFIAVELSPRGPTGSLQGTVTDDSTGLPIAGVTVHAVGEFDRSTVTDAAGNYNFPALSVGTYDVSASIFAYFTQTATVEIAEGATTVQDFALVPAPAHDVTGTVSSSTGALLSGAVVTILGTPIPPAVTDENGIYHFTGVPEGEYDLQASAPCNESQTQHLLVNSDETLDFILMQQTDAFGYICEKAPFDFIEASNDTGLYGDESTLPVSLPFLFTFYGQTYDTAYISTNGALNFLGAHAGYPNTLIPDFTPPNAAIYPFWDDMIVESGVASIQTEVLGSAPDRQFVIEWRNVAFFYDSSKRVRFEVILFEDGRILMQYTSIDENGPEQGDSATIGLENETSSVALQYSFNQTVLNEGLAVRYTPPPGGFVEGHVRDAADNTPLAGVQVKALEADRTTTTNADGHYRMFLPEGTHTLEASLAGYTSEQAVVNIVDQETSTQDFDLRSPRAQVTPAAFEFLVPHGQTRSASLTLQNIGLADLTFTIGEINVNTAMQAGVSPRGMDTHTASEDYQPIAASPVNSSGSVLVFMDLYPWATDALFQVLSANDIAFDVANSSRMSTIDLSLYEVIFLPSDQPSGFYFNYNGSFHRFEQYVQNGGLLWVGAAAWGFNGGDFTGGLLPGGARVGGFLAESFNQVLDPGHPIMQGVPNPFLGNSASHTYFENLPAGTNIIARGQASGQPTLIEYDFGNGRVLALAQTVEFGYQNGEDTGTILANGVPYVYDFEKLVDVPWLSEDIVAGTVPPGGSQTIQISVDTSALSPGFYKARLAIMTNDPHNPRLEIPVTLVVPAYMKAVNAGGRGYTDLAGDFWAADRRYTPGKWGFVNNSTVVSTTRRISGTADDLLYQNQRQNILEYRFAGLPPGTYQVELRFAELKNMAPNQRRFHVMIEGHIVLPFYDIALEVGRFAADNHTFYVAVTDGKLNIRFISYRTYGVPVINALRVIHRPDMP